MKFFLRHIMIAVALMGFTRLLAQTVPWATPAVSLISAPLIINCIPQVEGQTLTDGDYIGIFDDSDRCYGLARWKDTADFRITVYGSDGITDGFNAGDNLNLKLWISNENCILEHVSQVESDSPLIYSNTVTNRVNVLNFERVSVDYREPEFCLNETEIRPVISHPVADLAFQTIDALVIDEETGFIDPARNVAGNYNVSLNSGMCLTSNSINLTLNSVPRITSIPDTFICGEALNISANIGSNSVQWSTGATTPEVELTRSGNVWYRITDDNGCINTDTFDVVKIDITSVDYRINDADCYRQGSLEILDHEITNGVPPYIYKITNRVDNSVASNLRELPEGVYMLEIINDNGCVLRYRQSLVIEKECLTDRPVFSPNEDGLDDRYFISFEGTVRIFDRNGSLKRRLTGPVYFDGKDSSGNLLPMGTYLVVSDQGENITLTIIR